MANMQKNSKNEMVTFVNTRSNGKRPVPWMVRAYRNALGVVIEFPRIRLCNINGEEEQTTDSEGKSVFPVWNRVLQFNSGNVGRSIQLHPGIHKNVIQAIRNYPGTMSSSKTLGKNPIKGKCQEHEPAIEAKKRNEATLRELEIMSQLAGIAKLKSQQVFDYTCALVGIFGGNSAEKLNQLKSFVQGTPDNARKFMDVFMRDRDQKGANGEILPGDYQLVIKPELANKAIVEIALMNKIIVHKGGVYYIADTNIDLGIEPGKIHLIHRGKIGALVKKLELSGLIAKPPKTRKAISKVNE